MPSNITISVSGGVEVSKSGEVSDSDFATLISAGRAKHGTNKPDGTPFTDDEIAGLIIREVRVWLETYPLRAVPRAPFRPMMQPPPPMLDGKPVAPITVNVQ